MNHKAVEQAEVYLRELNFVKEQLGEQRFGLADHRSVEEQKLDFF